MRTHWLAIALTVGLSVPALAADVPDPRIEGNPLLEELLKSDPDAAQRVLDEIDAIEAANENRLPKGELRGGTGEEGVDAETQTILDQNPLFQDLYARDRGATLKLIKLVTGE